MFEPWKVQVERAITVEEKYGTAEPPIPTEFRGIAFRPAKNREKWLGLYSHRVVTAYGDHPKDAPVIILAPALTEVEERYGEGATPESVWAKHCPCPEKYGKPRFECAPALREFGVVHYAGGKPSSFEEWSKRNYGTNFPIIHAYRLNDWQQLYGEEIPDAKALEAKLRAEGKLEENQFIEAEMRWVKDGDTYVTIRGDVCTSVGAQNSPRAIVGTRKRRYMRVPVYHGDVVQMSILEKRSVSYVGISEFPGAQIIEE